MIPGSGRSTGEGIGYPLQNSQASLVAQLVKNLPAMWETWIRSLGWEDLPQKGKATHSSILTWRIPWTIQSMVSQRGHRVAQTRLSKFHFHASLIAQLGKNPPAMQETPVQFLGREDLLEKG